jgi:AcrR family transcriptional regulator
MKSSERLSSEERRSAIVRAVRQAFAAKGYHGCTTRELAEAAGVSEALLFKHFPNKEALFAAMQISCCNEQDAGKIEKLKALEPSASTMVLMVHFLVSKIAGSPGQEDEQAQHQRLMLRSLAEDGEFARLLLSRLAAGWVPKMEECLRAAVAAGEAVNGRVQPRLAAWFTHHLAVTIKLFSLPPTPVVDYDLPREKVVEQAVQFALRGLGLKEESIQRHYNPRALALFDA